MSPRIIPVVLALALAFSIVSSRLSADVVFFVNDQAGFAIANAGLVQIGFETFEQNTAMAPESINDPLSQNVPNGPFTTGLVGPITVQSNIDGGTSTTANPRGAAGLAVIPGEFIFPNLTDVVISDTFSDSTDFIFDAANVVTGVGFNTHTFFGGGMVNVQVFNLAGSLLGTQSIAADAEGINFLGIATNNGDVIGRINIFDPANGAEAGDNVIIFSSIPEPGSGLLLGLSVALGAALQRRRRF